MEKKQIEDKYKNSRKSIERMDWDEYFILQAYLVSIRSTDYQTQLGCVLVREDKSILATGYNGFVSNIDDKVLPNIRPEKYPYFIHAEHNALLSCVKNGVSALNSTAYVTGKPCTNCLQFLYQSGVKKIVYSGFSIPKICDTDEAKEIFDVVETLSGIEVVCLNPSTGLSQKISKIKALM